MPFEYEEAQFRLELLPGEQLPEVAVAMLEAGYESQPIRELAGLHRPTRRDAGQLFEEALATVRPDAMSVERAREVVRDHLIGAIADGSVDPFKGMRQLNAMWTALGHPADLAALVYLEDVACDYPDKQPAVAEEIVETARQLVAAKFAPPA